jgi:hypothetical protein
MALAIDDRKSNGALWNSIDWEKARRIVNRLQTRIVKAVKAKDKDVVTSKLDPMLIHMIRIGKTILRNVLKNLLPGA